MLQGLAEPFLFLGYLFAMKSHHPRLWPTHMHTFNLQGEVRKKGQGPLHAAPHSFKMCCSF